MMTMSPDIPSRDFYTVDGRVLFVTAEYAARIGAAPCAMPEDLGARLGKLAASFLRPGSVYARRVGRSRLVRPQPPARSDARPGLLSVCRGWE